MLRGGRTARSTPRGSTRRTRSSVSAHLLIRLLALHLTHEPSHASLVSNDGWWNIKGRWPGVPHVAADNGLARHLQCLIGNDSVVDIGAGSGQYGACECGADFGYWTARRFYTSLELV
ncbi:MAG: hypothetical protein SGPRY_002716 [Prymnesium sp.]